MSDKQAYEAFRVRKFAGPPVGHQAGVHDSVARHEVDAGEPCVSSLQPDQERVIVHFDVDAFYAQVCCVTHAVLAPLQQDLNSMTGSILMLTVGVSRQPHQQCKLCVAPDRLGSKQDPLLWTVVTWHTVLQMQYGSGSAHVCFCSNALSPDSGTPSLLAEAPYVLSTSGALHSQAVHQSSTSCPPITHSRWNNNHHMWTNHLKACYSSTTTSSLLPTTLLTDNLLQVEEVRNPALRQLPLGVTQKYLIVTCNYVARANGVTKLMGITDAKQKCPGLVLVSGEDLTPYRHASKAILAVLQRFGPAEKLGLDEVFVDVTQVQAAQ